MIRVTLWLAPYSEGPLQALNPLPGCAFAYYPLKAAIYAAETFHLLTRLLLINSQLSISFGHPFGAYFWLVIHCGVAINKVKIMAENSMTVQLQKAPVLRYLQRNVV